LLPVLLVEKRGEQVRSHIPVLGNSGAQEVTRIWLPLLSMSSGF